MNLAIVLIIDERTRKNDYVITTADELLKSIISLQISKFLLSYEDQKFSNKR